jgi:hypothetical protein
MRTIVTSLSEVSARLQGNIRYEAYWSETCGC